MPTDDAAHPGDRPATTLAALVAEYGGELLGAGADSVGAADDLAPDAIPIVGVCSLRHGRPGHVATDAYGGRDARWPTDDAGESVFAGAAVLSADATPSTGVVVWRHPRPTATFEALVRRFDPRPTPASGVHPSAVVAADAELGPDVSVEALAFVGPGVRLARGVRVGAGAVVEAGVCVGAESVVGPRAVLHRGVVVGAGVRIGAGSVIGGQGFGHTGAERSLRTHVGGVRIDDDVHIGDLVCVDAGVLEPTELRRGARIDNLVQVAHNVVVGAGAVVCAQAGIAGSSRIGARALLGGQVGIADHVDVGDEARVAAGAGVGRNVASGATVAGRPAVDHRVWLRELRLARSLERRLRALEAHAAHAAHATTHAPGDGEAP